MRLKQIWPSVNIKSWQCLRYDKDISKESLSFRNTYSNTYVIKSYEVRDFIQNNLEKQVYLKYVLILVMVEWWIQTSLLLHMSKTFQNKEFLISVNGKNQSSGDYEFIKISW